MSRKYMQNEIQKGMKNMSKYNNDNSIAGTIKNKKP